MITIIDYIGHCDLSGEPIGHPIKVINETIEMVAPFEKIAVAASEKHLKHIKNHEIGTISLKHSICAFSNRKIMNLVHKWSNLTQAFTKMSGKAWFINVDFSLFLYLFLNPKKNNKSIITLCYNPISRSSGWRKQVISTVLKRAFLVVITNANFKSNIPGNIIFIPDYYYSDDLYMRYISEDKEERMVCLGTMGETKKLEELVEVFAHEKYDLTIAGNFSQNPQRFEGLLSRKSENIELINKRVSDDEYYGLIAKSKYVVLPYDMSLYDERTSGILLETVFLHSVPIAPQKLLEYNNINGLGYEKIEDIPELMSDELENTRIIEENDALIRTVFSLSAIRNILKEKLIENS